MGSSPGVALPRYGVDMPVPAGEYQRCYAGLRDVILGHGANPAMPAQAVATMSVLEAGAEAVSAESWLSVPLTDDECRAFGEARLPHLAVC